MNYEEEVELRDAVNFIFTSPLSSVDDVKFIVESIEKLKDDNEIAHGFEDILYEKVLQALVDNNPNAKNMAIEALKTKDIDFKRWCA